MAGARQGLAARWTVAALVASLLAAALVVASRDRLLSLRARTRYPHVVMVTIDTLHVEYAGPLSDWVDFTPAMDALAAEGLVFARAYTTVPLTMPSHAALLSGRFPEGLGVMLNGDVLSDSVDTLAEMLSRAGYRTAAFTSLGVLRRQYNLVQGFEHYDDGFSGEPSRWYRTADEVLAAALPWMREASSDPFFLWLHLSDPHEPYVAKGSPPDVRLSLDDRPLGEWNLASKEVHSVEVSLPPGRHRISWRSLREPRSDDWSATSLRLRLDQPDEIRPWLAGEAAILDHELDLRPSAALELVNPGNDTIRLELRFSGRLESPPASEVWEQYRLEVEFVDRQLGLLREELDRLGIEGSVLWIVASDHGEGLWRHDVLGHAEFAHEDQLRILWMLKGAGIPAGVKVSDGAVLAVDLMPTVLALLGLEPPALLEGFDQRSCWDSAGCRRREEWWAYAADGSDASVTAVAGYREPYKLLWQRHPRSGCYQLDRDPWEAVNLGKPFSDQPDLMPADVLDLSQRIDGQRRRVQQLLEMRRTSPLDREQQEMLRSLGYLGD